jgi:hypothetical protein
MAPTSKTPAGMILTGASRDRCGGWSRFPDNLPDVLAQLPPLIALHLGGELIATIGASLLLGGAGQ